MQDPALAAQSFSLEGARCLYCATSALEMIQDKWEKKLGNPRYQSLWPAVEAGLNNIRKWYKRMDDTDVYILAMALNPVIKFAYIRTAWDPEYIGKAEQVLNETVRSLTLPLLAIFIDWHLV
jgi:hypothetical protein